MTAAASLLRVRPKHDAHEHSRAALDVLCGREFLRGMADASDARDEDHPHRPELRHGLGVMARTTWHHARGIAEPLRDVADDLSNRGIARCRHVLVTTPELERRAVRFADALRF